MKRLFVPCLLAAMVAVGQRAVAAEPSAAFHGLDRPGAMAMDGTGRLYVVEAGGTILAELTDTDGDGVFDRHTARLNHTAGLSGVAADRGGLWLSAGNRLLRLENGQAVPHQVAKDLPPVSGRRALALGVDHRVYVGGAPLMRYDPRDGALDVYAAGLAEVTGFGWHPETLGFWGVDHGPPGELNRLVIANHYGWPECRASHCPRTTPAALLLPGNPVAMVFLPQLGDAVVAVEDGLLRVAFDEGGAPSAVLPVLPERRWRPSGLAVAADGALLVAEAARGVIWRVPVR